jgi:hypothetical protein
MDYQLASLHQIETELKKRWAFPYTWHKKQDNTGDKITHFIYDFLYFEDLLAYIEQSFAGRQGHEQLKDYALNRWYNYWSSVAVERIFTSFQGTDAHPNEKHRSIDFYLQGVPFDHKSTVFPFGYPESQAFATQNPLHLVQWLYEAQSEQQRWHIANRLFLVFFHQEGFHWKLKAEIRLIQDTLTAYMQNFRLHELKQMALLDTLVWTDVIWIKA